MPANAVRPGAQAESERRGASSRHRVLRGRGERAVCTRLQACSPPLACSAAGWPCSMAYCCAMPYTMGTVRQNSSCTPRSGGSDRSSCTRARRGRGRGGAGAGQAGAGRRESSTSDVRGSTCSQARRTYARSRWCSPCLTPGLGRSGRPTHLPIAEVGRRALGHAQRLEAVHRHAAPLKEGQVGGHLRGGQLAG